MSQPSKKVQPTANPSCEQLRMPSGSVPGVGNMGVSTTSAGPSLDPDTLRKIAEAATPGPWEAKPYTHGPLGYGRVRVTSPSDEYAWNLAEEVLPANATHIATFDPPTVLALLSRVEKAERS